MAPSVLLLLALLARLLLGALFLLGAGHLLHVLLTLLGLQQQLV